MSHERWKPIPDWPCYKVSDLGRVKRVDTGLIMNLIIVDGYETVRLTCLGNRKSKKVHRLVLLAFVGPSELGTRHLDDNKTNNKLTNLVYGTALENAGDRVYDGGEDHHLAVLTNDQAQEIRARYEPFITTRNQLAKEYGVSVGTINNVIRNKHYGVNT
jgi:hypothetical protein